MTHETPRPSLQGVRERENFMTTYSSTKTRLYPPPQGVSTPVVEVPADVYDELVNDQRLLRALLADERAVPDGPLWQAVKWLADDLATLRLRQLSHAFSAAQDWTRVRPSHAELERRRNTYSTPARSSEQIRRDARTSWGLPA